MKRLKHFEHGQYFVTLESANGNYTVKLYIDDKPVPTTWTTTTLDAAIEMYNNTCKEVVKRS
jgi:hypothetical protein